MLRLDFTNFYSIFQSIFHPCLNEGIPIQSSSQKGDQCSHFLQCAHIEAVQIRRFSAHSRILSVYDMYWLAVWNWHRLTACWLIARSSATWNLNLLCLLSCIFIASAGLTNCVCSKGLNVFPTPNEQSQNAFCQESAVHPCSEIEVYLLRMLFLARVTFLFCPFWMDVHGILPSNPTRSELVQRVFVVNYS